MTDEGAREIADAIRRLAAAVTPNVAGTNDATGGHVESLTEAVMGMTAALVTISYKLDGIKDEMSEMGSITELVEKLDDLKDDLQDEMAGMRMAAEQIVDKLDDLKDET